MGSDDIENRMTSLGVNEMVFADYRSVEKVIQEIETVSEKSIKMYLKEHFDLEKIAVVLMGPHVSKMKPWVNAINFSKK